MYAPPPCLKKYIHPFPSPNRLMSEQNNRLKYVQIGKQDTTDTLLTGTTSDDQTYKQTDKIKKRTLSRLLKTIKYKQINLKSLN